LNNYTVAETAKNVLTLKFTDISAGWFQDLMFSSDHHLDNPYCNRSLLKNHLDTAKENNALAFFFGDVFCAMQGKFDKRSSMDDIRPEDVGENYLDRIVDHAAEFYEPYRDNIKLITKGNHETSIRKHHGTDLISSLVKLLNYKQEKSVYEGWYGGWVRLMFEINGTVRTSKNIKYHHGAGGGGPVTRGVIQTNRQAVYQPDANIVVNGHTHDAWIVPIARERLTQAGKIKKDVAYYLRTPSYKDEYADDSIGFHTEKWGAPKPLGCVWVRLEYDSKINDIKITPRLDIV
jgi:UDP-2,3-diacylglucosamine pyrophosphatase LpxH